MDDDATLAELEAAARAALEDLRQLRVAVSTGQKALTAAEVAEILVATQRALQQAIAVAEQHRTLFAAVRRVNVVAARLMDDAATLIERARRSDERAQEAMAAIRAKPN